MVKIKFSYLGKNYEMTADEIEAAYRYQEHEHRLADAKRHMIEKIYETDDPEAFSEAERQKAEEHFQKIYSIAVQDATGKAFLEEAIIRYENLFDCNIPENTTWESAINSML